MRVRLHHCLGLALAGLTIGQPVSQSEEPPRSKPTPIVFSAPKSDTVSSNLNQFGTRTSPLTDLESGLKKPFQIFDANRSSGEFRPANQFAPSYPVLKNKRMKDLLEKRAEDSYLLREDSEADSPQDDLLKSDDDSPVGSGRRGKTPLDRYYDGIERLRQGETNRPTGSLDFFAAKTDLDEKADSKSRTSGGLYDKELSAVARTSGQITNSASGGRRLASESFKPQSFGDIFGLDSMETDRSAGPTRPTRLEEFKRLIDGPGYGARDGFNVAPPSTSLSATYQPSKPVVVAPGSLFSTTPQPAGDLPANAPGFSGTVGVPMGVPDFAANSPSLTPTPKLQQTTPAPTPPVPKFSVPRRRF